MADWFDPAAIRFKISPHCDLAGDAGGAWDVERRFLLEQSAKFRAVRERYVDGRRWEDTDLFRDLYRRRFEQGNSVRGAATLGALLAQYYDRVDGLFADMKRDGFRLEYEGKQTSLPVFLIGRDGDVFIGNQGNHRLAMAQVLGLDKFAGRVICRHRIISRR